MENRYKSSIWNRERLITKFLVLEAALLVILVSWYVSSLYDTNESAIEGKLSKAADCVDEAFASPFRDAKATMSYIGRLMINYGYPKDTGGLLEAFHGALGMQNLVEWSAIAWDGHNIDVMFESKKLGRVKQKHHYNDPDSTDYFIWPAPPWTLQVSDTPLKTKDGSEVLPFGMAVTTEAGKYFGMLSAAYKIDSLMQLAAKALHSHRDLSFAIVGSTGQKIIEWDKGNKKLLPHNLNTIIPNLMVPAGRSKYLKINALPIFNHSPSFYIMKISYLQNCYVVVAIQEGIFDNFFGKSAKSALSDLVLVFLISIIIIAFMHKLIVVPMVELSSAAAKLTNEDYQTEIRDYQPEELASLAAALRKVISQKAKLDEVNEKMGFLLKQLEAMNKTKLDFIRNIQHELRTPLNHIIGGCEVLQSQLSGPIKEAYLEYIGIIHQSGKDLLTKINNIIAVADFEAGNVKLDEAYFSIDEILNSVVKASMKTIQLYKLHLSLDLQPGLPHVYVDAQKIKIALTNFLSNSIKFNKPEGSITITATRSIAGIAIEIADTGRGIEEPDLEKITEMFSTTGDVLTKVKSGLGLGLTIAQCVLDLHDIKMTIESKVDHFTKVKILIPNIRLKRTSQEETTA